jgi:recombination protein RecR
MQSSEVENLVEILSRLPGMGMRSANRLVVHLLKKKTPTMEKLIRSLTEVYEKSVVCKTCNNVDICNPCSICSDDRRDKHTVCIVSSMADAWAIERASFYDGVYHIIGGKLSAIDGVLPDDLDLLNLQNRILSNGIKEVIIAMSADLDGQTTMFFIKDNLSSSIGSSSVNVTTLSHGMPVGGEFDYLDEGTIMAAFAGRKNL